MRALLAAAAVGLMLVGAAVAVGGALSELRQPAGSLRTVTAGDLDSVNLRLSSPPPPSPLCRLKDLDWLRRFRLPVSGCPITQSEAEAAVLSALRLPRNGGLSIQVLESAYVNVEYLPCAVLYSGPIAIGSRCGGSSGPIGPVYAKRQGGPAWLVAYAYRCAGCARAPEMIGIVDPVGGGVQAALVLPKAAPIRTPRPTPPAGP